MSGLVERRIKRPDFAMRVEEFEQALFAERQIAERVLAGQQFNAYERANGRIDDDDSEDDEDVEFSVCLGPITDARFLFEVVGRDRATLVEAALKVATEAFLERAALSAARGGSNG